jgi:hypothetical protein
MIGKKALRQKEVLWQRLLLEFSYHFFRRFFFFPLALLLGEIRFFFAFLVRPGRAFEDLLSSCQVRIRGRSEFDRSGHRSLR